MSRLPEHGDVIAGKYLIESLLGQGGMGAVYVARHRVTGKRLALKMLLPEVADTTGSERFLREAQVAGSIQHRNVVDVYDIGSDAGGMYMVMELLDGKTLTELLQDEYMTLQQALLVLSRAMDGVGAAHAVGVIHRDLKPDNIFVCYGSSGHLDDPRVLDFGISKAGGMDARLTQTGAMLGTPYYMCFEQVNAQTDLDARVDVYAMGVILYEAIAGCRPYESDVLSALVLRISEGRAVPLHQLRPDVPRALCDVVMKAMARDREDRFATMAALSEAVEPFIPRTADLSVPADQALPLRTPPASARMQGAPAADPWTPAPSAKRSRGAWWLAPVILAAGAGAWWWFQPTLPGEESRSDSPVVGSSAPDPAAADAPVEQPPRAVEELAPREAAASGPLPARDEGDAQERERTVQGALEGATSTEAPPGVTPARKGRSEARRASARRRRQRGRAEAHAPEPEPSLDTLEVSERAPVAAPSAARSEAEAAARPVEAEGRAGRIGLDDF